MKLSVLTSFFIIRLILTMKVWTLFSIRKFISSSNNQSFDCNGMIHKKCLILISYNRKKLYTLVKTNNTLINSSNDSNNKNTLSKQKFIVVIMMIKVKNWSNRVYAIVTKKSNIIYVYENTYKISGVCVIVIKIYFLKNQTSLSTELINLWACIH